MKFKISMALLLALPLTGVLCGCGGEEAAAPPPAPGGAVVKPPEAPAVKEQASDPNTP